MKTTLNTYEIADHLYSDAIASWSRAGSFALAEWLEEYEESCGEEHELDVVAIRCDFSEYKSLLDFVQNYFADLKQAASALGLDLDMSGDELECGYEDVSESARDYICDRGSLIEFDGGIIVSSF